MGTLHGDQHTFLIISCSVLLRMGSVSDESCRENQDTHCVFNYFFFFIWKSIVEPSRPCIRIWCMCIVCWIPKAKTYSQTCNTYCFSTAAMVARTCLCYLWHHVDNFRVEKRNAVINVVI